MEVMEEPARPKVPPWPRVWLALAPVLVVMTMAAVIGAATRVPYFALSPGSARSTEPLVTLIDRPGFRTDGEILFTTVSIGRPSGFEAVWGWLDPDVDVAPEEVIQGDQSDEENRQLNLALMDDSKQVASYVALRHLGFDVSRTATGAVIVQVLAEPARGELEAGDVVVGIDGTDVGLTEELIDAIGTHEPGEEVTLRVERGSTERTEDVRLTLAADPQGEPVIGVAVQPRGLRYRLPVDVEIDSGDVGGPSAGLAFTLAVLDRLTPGSLTGGNRVAVTGSIQPDGGVGPVGGVGQKAVAAEEEGAELFLVPADEAPLAEAHAGDMRVVGVATLSDALRALDNLGGNALALGQPGRDSSGT